MDGPRSMVDRGVVLGGVVERGGPVGGGVVLRVDGRALVLDVGHEAGHRVGVVRHNLDSTVRQSDPEKLQFNFYTIIFN